jgi:hypothetical protein
MKKAVRIIGTLAIAILSLAALCWIAGKTPTRDLLFWFLLAFTTLFVSATAFLVQLVQLI